MSKSDCMNETDLIEIDNLRITLFYFQSLDIKITQVLYFSNEDLVFEGYDIGKRVSEAFGDSDYEYDFSVPSDEVEKFYPFIQSETW